MTTIHVFAIVFLLPILLDTCRYIAMAGIRMQEKK